MKQLAHWAIPKLSIGNVKDSEILSAEILNGEPNVTSQRRHGKVKIKFMIIDYRLTVQLNNREVEAEIQVSLSGEYDGVGAFEYWGDKGFDKGNWSWELEGYKIQSAHFTDNEEEIDLEGELFIDLDNEVAEELDSKLDDVFELADGKAEEKEEVSGSAEKFGDEQRDYSAEDFELD